MSEKSDPGERQDLDQAIARAELGRFPVGPIVIGGSVLCLVGVVIGLAIATGKGAHPGLGAAIAIGSFVQLLILCLAGVAVRAIENSGISSLRAQLNATK
jgi:hypothetical protein